MTDRDIPPAIVPPVPPGSLRQSTDPIGLVMSALVIVSLTLAAGIVAIILFGPSEGQSQNITLLISAISPVLVALVGFLIVKRGELTERKVEQLSVVVDGRLTQLLEKTAEAAKLAGMAAERQIAADRAATVEVDRAEDAADRAAAERSSRDETR